MKLGIAGRLFPLMFSKVVYGYTAKAVPELSIREFKKRHKKEYEAMVRRKAPSHEDIRRRRGLLRFPCSQRGQIG